MMSQGRGAEEIDAPADRTLRTGRLPHPVGPSGLAYFFWSSMVGGT
jgi:hypothetical protein